MTLNKHFVFIPTELEHDAKPAQILSDAEIQRQAMVEQAQKEGGL